MAMQRQSADSRTVIRCTWLDMRQYAHISIWKLVDIPGMDYTIIGVVDDVTALTKKAKSLGARIEMMSSRYPDMAYSASSPFPQGHPLRLSQPKEIK